MADGGRMGVWTSGVFSSDLSDIGRCAWGGAGIAVVAGARMSMSFPVLFSTVPVYHLGNPGDLSRRGAAPLRVPLSDGGIVSNFPIHKLDRALSPWPTRSEARRVGTEGVRRS